MIDSVLVEEVEGGEGAMAARAMCPFDAVPALPAAGAGHRQPGRLVFRHNQQGTALTDEKCLIGRNAKDQCRRHGCDVNLSGGPPYRTRWEARLCGALSRRSVRCGARLSGVAGVVAAGRASLSARWSREFRRVRAERGAQPTSRTASILARFRRDLLSVRPHLLSGVRPDVPNDLTHWRPGC